MITLRPGTRARFSTNFYHGTWHILSDPHGALLLSRLLWACPFNGNLTRLWSLIVDSSTPTHSTPNKATPSLSFQPT
ncbi:hypothetical protein [Nonomuraea sp. CA-141351]|uniref:hypothetical protein n=1 Tax=Nonomuraea sp. CA-141351 TaxID=3239996 RepID=UPI003D8C2DBA